MCSVWAFYLSCLQPHLISVSEQVNVNNNIPNNLSVEIHGVYVARSPPPLLPRRGGGRKVYLNDPLTANVREQL